MKKSLTERSLTKAEIDKSEEIIKKLKGNKKDFVKRYGKDAEAVMYGRAVNMAKKQVENMEGNKLKEMIKKALSKPQVEGKKVDMDKDGDIDSKDYLLKRDQAIKKSKGEMKEETRSVGSMVKTKEFEVGDKVKYKGMNHEITRVVDDRIYIKNLKYSGRPDTWVKAADLKSSMNEANGFKSGKEFINIKLKKYPKAVAKVNNLISMIGEDKFTMEMAEWINDFFNNSAYESPVNEDLDLGHTDNEPHMIKGELYQISKDALDLYDMVSDYEGKGEVDFPAWWQSKITTAKNMMSGTRNYLEFELEEPNIDNNISFIDDSDMLDESKRKK